MNGHTITYSTTIHITSRTGTPFFINKSSSEPFIVSSIALPSPSLPNSTKAYFTFTFTLHGLGTPTHPNTVSRFSSTSLSEAIAHITLAFTLHGLSASTGTLFQGFLGKVKLLPTLLGFLESNSKSASNFSFHNHSPWVRCYSGMGNKIQNLLQLLIPNP